MDKTIEQLQNASTRINYDITCINKQLAEFREKHRILEYGDPDAIHATRTDLSQILTDIAVLISSIVVLKKKVVDLVIGAGKYSLLPTKRNLLNEMDENVSNFRTIMYSLKEVAQHLRDSHYRLVNFEKGEGNE